jgi:hypothetical protein
VDTACSIAVLTLDAKHQDTIRGATTASIQEYGRAVGLQNYQSAIPEAWKAIVAFSRSELK